MRGLGRWRLVAVCVAVLASGLGIGTASGTPGVTSAPRTAAAPALFNKCHRSAIDVPSCGVLWGIYTPAVPGRHGYAPHYQRIERAIGRRLDIVKDYVDWQHGVTFPNKTFSRLAAHGRRIVYISWNAINYDTHRKVSYQSIADGDWDKGVILPEARRLKAFHHKIFLDFNHEFDTHAQLGKGSPAQYVAAYRHIHHLFREVGVRNVIWSWVSTGTIHNIRYIKASWPGRRYVDWVGYDPYNFASCTGRPWRSAYRTFRPFYRWLRTQPGMRHKPILLGEYATAPGRHIKHWYAAIPKTLRRLPHIKAMFQWSAPTLENCKVSLADSRAAMAGFRKAGKARAVTGRR